MSTFTYSWNDLAHLVHLSNVVKEFREAFAEGKNILLVAPPGSDAAWIARRAFLDMEPLTKEERGELTKLYRNAQLLREHEEIRERPFRAPHHTISDNGMSGVVRTLMDDSIRVSPGEIALAHAGVLYLDSLLDFRVRTVEYVRRAQQDGTVRLYYKGENYTFPSKIRVLGSTTPCLCGWSNPLRVPHRVDKCVCTKSQKALFESRLERLNGGLFDTIIRF